jgi:hypothetical protein
MALRLPSPSGRGGEGRAGTTCAGALAVEEIAVLRAGDVAHHDQVYESGELPEQPQDQQACRTAAPLRRCHLRTHHQMRSSIFK